MLSLPFSKKYALRTEKCAWYNSCGDQSMKWLTYAKETYDKLQEWTKILLVFCGGYIASIALCSGLYYIFAGRLIGYYTAMAVVRDLLYAIRPCIAISAIGTMALEAGLLRTQ